MATVIVWQAGASAAGYVEGHVRITRPLLPMLEGETESQYLDRVAADAIAKDPSLADFSRVAAVDENTLPARTHRQWWRFVGGVVAVDQSLVNAAALQAIADHKAAAKALYDKVDDLGRIIRAVAIAAKMSDNINRDWTTQFMAATAAATSLANFQARVAALPNLPALQNSDVKQFITNIIDGE